LLEDGLSLNTVETRYRNFFDDKGCYRDPIYVDGNPNHLVIGYVPGKIKLINPNAKILICVREPVARFVSHLGYFMAMRPGRESGNLSGEAMDLDKFDNEADYVPYMCPEWGNYKPMYIETGCYSHYIGRFANLFDTKIMVFEEYIENPQGEIDQIMDWIERPRFDIMDSRTRNKNETPWNPCEDHLKPIAKFYEPYNEQLFKGLGRELWKS
jgi:hypothetical protein